MKKNTEKLFFWFMSTLMAMVIWTSTSAVKAAVTKPSDAILAEYEAHYAVKILGLKAGESVHRLHHRQDGLYHFEIKTEPKYKLIPYHYVEKSDFEWTSGKIKPLNYFYQIKEGTRFKKGNVSFDWEHHLVSNTTGSEPWKATLPPNLLDKLTQGLLLRYDLLQNHTHLVYTVAEDDEIKPYTFKILGEEQITTPMGTYLAVKVEHVHRKGYRTNLWFAKKLNYLPIKMNQLRSGRVVAQAEITSVMYPKR